MTQIHWNAEKAAALRADSARGNIGFEDCLIAIEEGRILDILRNPTRPHQRMFVLEINGYAHVVPFVEDENGIFLKTVYPSRKHTALYLSAGDMKA